MVLIWEKIIPRPALRFYHLYGAARDRSKGNIQIMGEHRRYRGQTVVSFGENSLLMLVDI